MAGVAPIDPTKLEAQQIEQFKNFLMSYNKLTEICFADCVHDFTLRDVRDKEVSHTKTGPNLASTQADMRKDKCSKNCMEKYLKMNQRVSQRFQEFQMQQNEAALASVSKSPT